jgi:16S rRNA (cytosine967-C5)-methyltransferase
MDDGARVLVEVTFAHLWANLFSTPIHLDSALAKLAPRDRARLAELVPALMRRPVTLARALNIRHAPGEPWSLSHEQRAQWKPAQKIVARLLENGEAPHEGVLDDFPPSMLDAWRAAFGDEVAIQLAQTLSGDPPLALRVSRKQDRAQVIETLGAGRPSSISPVGVALDRYLPVTKTELFESGAFEIQDEGSQVLALFALHPEVFASMFSPAPGPVAARTVALPRAPKSLTVVDACADAGGKTLALADALAGRGRVFAYDVSERRLGALKKRAQRAGFTNVKTQIVEEDNERALAERFRERADVLLVDAPCSGWGVLRRNPDVKWRQDAAALERFPVLQLRLLEAFAPLVAPKGRLVYGVCTFRPEETTLVADAFARAHPELRKGAGGYLGPGPGDGFYGQVFERL